MNIVPPPDPDPAEVTLHESVKAAAADAADLVAMIPGGDPARLGPTADRLSEEFAEAAQMLRSLPDRPYDASGHDWQLLAALRTAHAAGEDVAETIARALVRLDAELDGGALSNRPGSWEAALVQQLLDGTVTP